MKSEILSDKEIRKYALQIQLPSVGLSGQEKFKKARILLIGAGGKGTSILQAFVSAGIGFIGICDSYMVEESVLPRQSLYGETDLGKQKAIISRQHLYELSRMSTIELHNICLSESNILNIISDYDILIDATDNFPAHYLINDASVTSGKPLVFGSVFHNSITTGVFNYLNGPSLRDLYPDTPHDTDYIPDEGITASYLIYSIAGNLMANEVLKIILGLENVLSGKLLRFNLKDYSLIVEQVKPNTF